ncbi:hypothetical protein GCM10023063_14980 [Arthrobacter methylotrophus]|uniref:DivIVA domain-containing protein n=1 Tax=Arthrobacter methylotrophus TaxID=121291 RepID=A0ABV5UN23_9MICC
MNDARQPRGTPAGGQFSPTAHREPDVALTRPITTQEAEDFFRDAEAFDAVVEGDSTPEETRTYARAAMGERVGTVSDEHLDQAIAAVAKSHTRRHFEPEDIGQQLATQIRLDQAVREFNTRSQMDPAEAYDRIYKQRNRPEQKYDFARRALNHGLMSGSFDTFSEHDRGTIVGCAWNQETTNSAVDALEPSKRSFPPEEFAIKLARRLIADDKAHQGTRP